MKTDHIVFLILAITAAISSLTGIVILFWHAFQAAKKPFTRTTPAVDSTGIQWTEAGALTLVQKTMGRVNRVLADFAVKTLPQNVLPMMTDPVDGTAFQVGDDVARCACGTNYHMHSWQWLMEKAEGRCVNCKHVAVPQRVTA
jgi:hypothetical protein